MGTVVGLLAVGTALIFLRVGWVFLSGGSTVWLATLPSDPPPAGWPRLAVLFAARNEAAAVERATASMLAQDYPYLELIAVDDRSTDATGAMLDALAAPDARMRVVHVHELPAEWLGKNHALQCAFEATEAEWLLFTDADVVFEPLALRRAIAFAVAERVDHLVVAPHTVTESEGERAFLAMFCLLFALRMPPWKVADPWSKTALGLGAFNLVRAEALRAIGGLRRLSLSVDDDIKLGVALKFAGYRPALIMGRDAVSVRWQVGLGGMIRGVEKNFFAVCDFRLSQVIVVMLVLLGLGILPYALLFVGPLWARAVALFAIVVLMLSLSRLKGQNHLEWYHALVLPIGTIACLIALLRSVCLTAQRRGVRWRDHFYPLDQLKAHVRRRNAWLRELWLSTR